MPALQYLVRSLLCLPVLAAALPSVEPSGKLDRRYVEKGSDGGPDTTIFEHAATRSKIQYVTNSGICETTPGVNQYSGYLSAGSNMNMWFWFFEARNNASSAPLAIWLNGGPGCSSMIGLFQENGPCQFYNGSSTPSVNPHSWSNYANMLYVDQPIGTGFSYGTDDATSTVTAAPYVWTFLQAFYTNFPQYESRQFGLWTESYGGRYGPDFAAYFQSQNAAIDAGTVKGEKIDLVALGINNGWFDPIIQYEAYVQFSYNNTYKPLISSSDYQSYMSDYQSQCLPYLQKCTGVTGSNSACNTADNDCYNAIEGPISNADFDVYDIRAPSNDPNPPETYVTYLQSSSVVKAIGAKSTYAECPNAPGDKIDATGDEARSFLPDLSTVVQSGINVLVWAGDADWICNWFGCLTVANAVQYSGSSKFSSASVAPYTVSGVEGGTYKTVGNFNWLRVYGAGHEIPFYQPQISLQVFEQIMKGQPLTPT